ncbi:MAG: hypothetical protein NXH90_00570 [Flavobacteriaceae bacterium]|nr:hypothetical protein [Flavobacteriaceae bacterium]
MRLSRRFDPRKRKLDTHELELERKRKIERELQRRSELEHDFNREPKRSNLHELGHYGEPNLELPVEKLSLSSLLQQKALTISSKTRIDDLEEIDSNSDKNSRCVPVATAGTISPAPDGRRAKKERFKGKSQIIKFRCTTYEKKLLQAKAKRCGISLSDMLRKTAMEQSLTERFSGEEIELYKMLVKYHNNFKSIGNMFKKKSPNLTQLVYETAKEIKMHLKKFKT